MNENQIISKKNSIKILSILLLIIFEKINLMSYISYLAFWWCVILVIMGNIRRLSYVNKMIYFVRMTLYFVIFALPSIIEKKIAFDINNRITFSLILVIIFFCIWLSFNLKSIKLVLSKQLIAESHKESRYVIILRIYNLLGAAICEEVFFRQYILSEGYPILIVCCISIIYFILSHWLLPWSNRFTKTDFFNQAIFSTMNVFIYIYSESILPCILLHIMMNSINIAKLVRTYDRHYRNVKKYDKLLVINNYPELDI